MSKGSIDKLIGDSQIQLDEVEDLIDNLASRYDLPSVRIQQIRKLLGDIYSNLDSIATQAENMINNP